MNNRPDQVQDRTAGIEDKYSIQTPIKLASKRNRDVRT